MADPGIYDLMTAPTDQVAQERADALQSVLRRNQDFSTLAALSGAKSLQPFAQATGNIAHQLEGGLQEAGTHRLTLAAQMAQRRMAQANADRTYTLQAAKAADAAAYHKGMLANAVQRTGLTGLRAGVGGEQLDDDSVEMLARAGIQSGDLNKYVSGLPRQSPDRARVTKKAAEILGGSGGNLVDNAAGFSADQTSLKGLQKDRDNLKAYSDMVDKNLGLMENAAAQITDTGSPMLNQPIRWLANHVMGSEDQAKFESALLFAQTEAARVLNNPRLVGPMTNEQKDELKQIASGNGTVRQLHTVANLVRTEKANRLGAMDNQIGEIRTRIHGRAPQAKTTTVGSATQDSAPAQGAAAGDVKPVRTFKRVNGKLVEDKGGG